MAMPDDGSKRLCWSYQRTSTARQAQEDRSGMARQEEALTAWLADHSEYVLQEALVDSGVSAGSGKHRTKGALGRFIAAGRTGAIPAGSCLVVESVSRFSREASTDALMSLLGDVLQPGLSIAFTGYASGKVISAESWNREPGLKYGLIAALDSARVEWEERSARSKGGARKRERQQEGGEKVAAATPWWIARDPETRRLVRDASGNMLIDPVARTTILRAAELACAGMGSTLIAETLNREQRPLPKTAGRKNQYSDKAGDKWTHGRLTYLFRHRALLGDLVRRDGRIIAGFYPPVLSIERWHELRGSVETRDKLRGSLRGGGQQVRNLFMGLSRCGICGGPFSFHDSSERARIGHPGYMACRAANRRNAPTCTNSGYLDYSHWEAHCLTRLMAPLWDQLLGTDEQAQEVARLQEEANALALEQRTLEAQLERAEARLKELWVSEASDLKQEIAEAAVADLRERTATARTDHTTAITELQLLSAKPTGSEAAWQLREKVGEFWRRFSAGEMEPVERRNFNRWLRSRRPTIEFRACPPLAEGGQPLIELVLDGVVVDTQPLAGNARLLALDEGMVDPAFVRENPDGSGAHIALWEPTLEEEWELN